MTGTREGPPEIVCLLPARNCAEHLDAYFESVGRFADAVVALDDGSTDETAERLRSHPLVRVVLANPRREGYIGWDDGANRNRLLETAAALRPRWIVSPDADERIAEDDAAALRRLVAEEGRPGFGYLLRCFAMVGESGGYVPGGVWFGRLFAYEAGQAFPRRRLHGIALPTTIGPERFIKTTIRIQHLGGASAERRRARYAKYQEADPDRRDQRSYENLLRDPYAVRQWRPRDPHLPLIAGQPQPVAQTPEADGQPLISAIVISRNDEAVIERVLAAVVTQACPVPFEVILVTSGSDATARIARERFPQVRVVELDAPALPGRARNAGLALARGAYVTFPGSHVELTPGSMAARVRAHRLGYSMVSGSMRNGVESWVGWGAFFLDHRTALPGRPSARLTDAPVRCSYLRSALLEVGGFPEDVRTGEDTIVNQELFDRGYGAYYSSDIVTVHSTPCRSATELFAHHFRRGAGMARVLRPDPRVPLDRRLAKWLLGVVPARLYWTTRDVERWGRGLRARYLWALPLVLGGVLSAWLGACSALLRRRRDALIEPGHAAPTGRPAQYR